MVQKTNVHAEDGKQDLIITRTFDLPVALLFKAYVEPDIVAQWMGTKVLKLDSNEYGSYQFETTDGQGNQYALAGVIHEFVPNQLITRTFRMERTPAPGGRFPVLLEFLTFAPLTDDTSNLTMHIVCQSVAVRDQLLRLPFAQGINKAHDRLQSIINQTK